MEDEDAFLYGDSEPAAPAKTAFQAELKAADVPLGQPMEGQEGFDTGTGAGTEAEEGEEEDIEEEDSDEDIDIILDGDTSRPAIPQRPRPVSAAVPITENREESKQPAAAPADSTTEYKPLDRSDPNALLKPSMLSTTPAGPGSTDRNRFPTPPPDPNAPPPLKGPPVEPPPDVNVEAVIVSGYEDKDGTRLIDYDFDATPDEEKAWRRTGAHVADWFNYGFDEATWRTYVAKQKKLRGEENRNTNPFAAFATGDLQEAWASLPPELKGLMMQTVMGAGGGFGGQPGLPPQGMNGMNGMPGMPPLGMDQMMMNGFGLGMPPGMMGGPPPPQMQMQGHMGGQTPLGGGQPPMSGMDMSRGLKQESGPPSEAGGDMSNQQMGGYGDMDDMQRQQMMQDPSFGGMQQYPGMEGYMQPGMDPNMYNGVQDPYAMQGYAGPDNQMGGGVAGRGRGARGRGVRGASGASGFLAAAAARGRGRGGPGQGGSPALGGESSPDRPPGRVNAPLPVNIPTGPRSAAPAPTAPRGPRGDSRSYHDKDAAGGRGDDGLDYGGTGDSPHEDRKRRHRDYDERSERSRSRDRGERDDGDRDGHRSSRHRHRRHRSRSRSHEASSRDKTYDGEEEEAHKSKSSSSRRSRRDREHRDSDRDREHRDADREPREEDGKAQEKEGEEEQSSSRKRSRTSKDDRGRDDRERSSRSSKRERVE